MMENRFFHESGRFSDLGWNRGIVVESNRSLATEAING